MSKTTPAHQDGSRRKDFGQLSSAEKKLRAAVARGEDCVISETRPEGPTDNNRIRPGFLRFLARDGDDKIPVHAKGIRLVGACIGNPDGDSHDLDLDGCTVAVPLILKLCHVPGTVKLEDAKLQSVTLDGSRIGGLKGDGARFDGSLNLRRYPLSQDSPVTPFEAHGEVRLLGATISGSLACRGGTFKNPSTKNENRTALNCDRLKVTGTVSLNDNFEAHGAVRLLGAIIGSNFSCREGTFHNASTEDNNRTALNCNRFKVTGNVFLDDNFQAYGEVRLLGATIGGNLACSGGTFQHAGGDALNCDGIKITGDVFLNERFKADGEVRLIGATIGGDLVCREGTFQNAGGDALSCDGVEVTGSVFLNERFKADGEVRLLGATIGGDLACMGGRFACSRPAEDDNTRCATALQLQAATIRGAFQFRQPDTTVEGSIDLSHAHVRVLVDDAETWPSGTVQDAKTGNNLFCHVNLDGFTYERLGGAAPTDAKMRQEWLEKQPPEHLARDFRPQPFEQVVKVLRETGHGEEAKKIAIARKRYDLRNSFYRLRPWVRRVHPGAFLMRCEYIKYDSHAFQKTERTENSGNKSSVLRSSRLYFEDLLYFLFFDILIGYGYKIKLALWIAVFVFLFSTLIFYKAHEQGAMVPADARVFMDEALREACTDPDSQATWSDCEEPPMEEEHTPFQPIAYALDVIVPLAPLGQESEWKPASWLALTVMWFNIGYGWFVGLLATIVVSGAIKPD